MKKVNINIYQYLYFIISPSKAIKQMRTFLLVTTLLGCQVHVLHGQYLCHQCCQSLSWESSPGSLSDTEHSWHHSQYCDQSLLLLRSPDLTPEPEPFPPPCSKPKITRLALGSAGWRLAAKYCSPIGWKVPCWRQMAVAAVEMVGEGGIQGEEMGTRDYDEVWSQLTEMEACIKVVKTHIRIIRGQTLKNPWLDSLVDTFVKWKLTLLLFPPPTKKLQ